MGEARTEKYLCLDYKLGRLGLGQLEGWRLNLIKLLFIQLEEPRVPQMCLVLQILYYISVCHSVKKTVLNITPPLPLN